MFVRALHPFCMSEHAVSIPFALSSVRAGFPSPASDYLEELDLYSLLVPRPAATFFIRVEGDSMAGAGIVSGDILVVDRAREPRSGDVVLAVLDGEFRS